MIHADRFYIDGRWLEPHDAAAADVVNPATEEVIACVALGGPEDVSRAVAAARRAFDAYSAWSQQDRAALLERLLAQIESRADAIARTLTAEMGVAISYARSAQIPLAASHVRVAAQVVRDYAFVQLRGATAIAREPIGVCGLITPWNWPLFQITAKVAPALAAGCTVVLKPSELAPLTALSFAEMAHEAGVPPGVFNLVNGTGEAVGAAIASHPDVDMVSITGSTRAGAAVARLAAPTVKRVTQELGGKSPNVVLPDADLAQAVPRGVMTAFRNVGQSCSAPTRMLVPRQRLSEVEDFARRAVGQIVVGDPLAPETTLGPIANAAQWQRVQTMIQAGLEEGATLLCGGLGRPANLTKGYFAKPTIFTNVDPGMRIAREEIFGPVLCILAYDTVEDAIRIANDTPYGLGAHVQSADLEQARAVAARIRAGQVHINYPAWDVMAPFGGYKQSGNGREYGELGFEEYLETKAILGYR